MQKLLLVMFSFLLLAGANAQTPSTGNAAFDAELKKLLPVGVPLLTVKELRKRQQDFTILDTREAAEFGVSHIPGSRFVGFNTFDAAVLGNLPKETPIVLYCSVGYRSGKVGEQLQALGFTKVYNLYGSIFEWANEGYPLENKAGKPTTELHTYNQEWSKWVENPKVKKVW